MLADNGGDVVFFGGFFVVAYVLSALAFAGIFKKADQPIWAAFVPIVNLFFLLKTVGRPGWWLILFLIPCVGTVVYIIVMYDLAQSFGHAVGVTILLILFSFFTMLWLGFGQSQYRGPAAAQPAVY